MYDDDVWWMEDESESNHQDKILDFEEDWYELPAVDNKELNEISTVFITRIIYHFTQAAIL